MFTTGNGLVPEFFKGFGNCIKTGLEESAALWYEYIDSKLDSANEERGESSKEKELAVVEEEGIDLEELDIIGEDEEHFDDDSDKQKLKTKSRFKPGNLTGRLITDLYGCNKKLKKLDMQALSVLESTRPREDEDEKTIENIYKSATADVMKSLLQYYYNVLDRYSSASSSSCIRNGANSSSSSSSSSSSINIESIELSEDIVMKLEEIKTILNKKSNTKKVVFDALMEIRKLLSTDVNEMICQEAKIAISGIDQAVQSGQYSECWGPWAQRFKQVAIDIEKFEMFDLFSDSLQKLRLKYESRDLQVEVPDEELLFCDVKRKLKK
jgi:hypothetical protein